VIDVYVSPRRDSDVARRFFHRTLATTIVAPVEVVRDQAAGLSPGARSSAPCKHGIEHLAYCCGGYCMFAYDAVRQLRASGYRAARLAEGILEWRLAVLPVSTTAA
jgi:transposase-like protein